MGLLEQFWKKKKSMPNQEIQLIHDEIKLSFRVMQHILNEIEIF